MNSDRHGAIRATANVLRMSRQISQPEIAAMSAFFLYGAMHGR